MPVGAVTQNKAGTLPVAGVRSDLESARGRGSGKKADYAEAPVKDHGRIEQKSIWLNEHVEFRHVKTRVSAAKTGHGPKREKKKPSSSPAV